MPRVKHRGVSQDAEESRHLLEEGGGRRGKLLSPSPLRRYQPLTGVAGMRGKLLSVGRCARPERPERHGGLAAPCHGTADGSLGATDAIDLQRPGARGLAPTTTCQHHDLAAATKPEGEVAGKRANAPGHLISHPGECLAWYLSCERPASGLCRPYPGYWAGKIYPPAKPHGRFWPSLSRRTLGVGEHKPLSASRLLRYSICPAGTLAQHRVRPMAPYWSFDVRPPGSRDAAAPAANRASPTRHVDPST